MYPWLTKHLMRDVYLYKAFLLLNDDGINELDYNLLETPNE